MKQAKRLWIYWLVLTAFVAGMFTFALPSQPAAAVGPWSPIVGLTGTDRPAEFVDIAVDATGVAHIVYEDLVGGTFNGPREIKYINNRTGSWSSPAVISSVPNHTFATHPKIATRTFGSVVRVDVAFGSRVNSGDPFNNRIYHTSSNDGGVSWSTAINISGNVPGFDSAVTIDAFGVAHVAWGGYVTFTSDAVYAIFYNSNPNGAWGGPQRIAERIAGNSYNNYPDIVTTFNGAEVTVHVMYMGNVFGGGELGKTVYSLRKIGGGSWSAPQLRQQGGANFPKFATDGNAVIWATWQAAIGEGPNFEVFQVISFDNGANWQGPFDRTGRAGISARPDIARAYNGTFMIAFDETFGSNDKEDPWSIFSNDGLAWQAPVRIFEGGGFSKEVEIAGSCENFHVAWHDGISGVLQIFYSQTGPSNAGCTPPVTPTPTVTPSPTITPSPTVPPVDFNPTRTSASPTQSTTIGINLNIVGGAPDQMRYSLTPFTADAPGTAPAWQGITPSFNYQVANPPATCGVVLYLQVRNSTNGQFSQVKTISAVIDNKVQAVVNIRSMQDIQLRDPNAEQIAPGEELSAQPNAPDPGDPNYTRDSTYYYSVSEEPGQCVGMQAFSAEQYTFTKPDVSFPAAGIVPFRTFDNTADNNGGRQFNEQLLTGTVVATDTLGNSVTVTGSVNYDDDPPVLESSGTITFTQGASTNYSLVTANISATVTDDSYGEFIGQLDKAYWGVWMIASNTATPPSTLDFQVHGTLRRVVPGTTVITNVPLVNGLNASMDEPGPRYVHLRFVDGAGNYTEDVLISPEITLESGFRNPTSYIPVLRR